MASSSILLSEEQVQCSICLEMLTEPVSTPCGHNFCMACIRGYWDTTDLCYCPMCKEKFNTRPDLRVNTFIAEMATQLKMLSPAKVTHTAPNPVILNHGSVTCDVCTVTKVNAVKSCLVCLTSYCETHLEPHGIAAALKKHKLIHPVEDLEDRVCKKHERPLELFCREDQTCVCQFCMEGDHKAHKTVPIEEEFRVRKSQLGKMKGKLRKMIQERQKKVKDIELAVKHSKAGAEKELSESVKVLTALVRCVERCQAELIEVIEENQKGAEKESEELIEELEQEILELQKKSAELEELSHTEDHLPFLQSSPALSTLPLTKDWSEIRVDIDVCVGPVMRALSHLEKTLGEELTDIKLRMRKQCAVDVILDTDTANALLILSEDGKQARVGSQLQIRPYNSKRFDHNNCVLGKQGFSSGKFYYEVLVKEKTGWIIGVATESTNRKSSMSRSPVNGHWALGMWGEGHFTAHAGPDVRLHLRDEPQKVGVFVDYEGGEVTFYDADAGSQIYSFTGCAFTERLYPCFSTGVNADGKNAAPLIICPVSLVH